MIGERETSNRKTSKESEEKRNNINSAFELPSTIAYVREGMPQGNEAESKGYVSFKGWFNNRMMVILMLMQDIRRRESRSMLRAEFFLEDVEHHFVKPSSGREIRNAFRWMRRYLKQYPQVTREHSRKALDQVSRIYDAVADECGPMRNPIWDIKNRLDCAGNFEKKCGVIIRKAPVSRVA